MAQPTINCPKCGAEIKLTESLTESLAAPAVASTRAEYEKKLAQKDSAAAALENTIRQREEAVRRTQETLDQQVADRLRAERVRIAAEEAKKAKLAAAAELEQKAGEVTALQQTLRESNAKLSEAQKAQAELLVKQRELDDARREMALTIQRQVQAELAAVRQKAQAEAEESLKLKVAENDQSLAATKKQLEEEARKATLAAAAELEHKGNELTALQQVLKENNAKLAEAQKAQALLVVKERQLDDARREMELSIQRKVQENLSAERQKARAEAEESLALKVAEKDLRLSEKDQTIAAMKKQLEEAQRKAEQGSQQSQGEALELQLEALLAARFPHDRIEPVPKGEHGGDILHRVVAPGGGGGGGTGGAGTSGAGGPGNSCGTILWEFKRTKNWSDSWLPKLRDDQRAAKAELAVLVSAVLPKGVDSFDLIDGIWLAHPRCVLPLALVLRGTLLEVAAARQSAAGLQTKAELVYQYLTGPRFKLRVQAIVEAFTQMQDDLQKERKAITKQWAKRESEITRVLEATVGMYGDLQGIAGKTLAEIEGLDMKLLDSPSLTD